MGGESTRPRPDDLLDGWKAIADHLGRTQRTVQRWEKSKGLPARRLQAVSPDELPRVFVYKSEVDALWNEQQTKQSDKTEKEAIEAIEEEGEEVDPAAGPPSPITARPRQQAIYMLIAAAILALAAGAIAWPGIQKRLWPQERVLAVMPVRNLSGAGDPEPLQLAEALTEETGLGVCNRDAFASSNGRGVFIRQFRSAGLPA